jgi:hypothetical protein
VASATISTQGKALYAWTGSEWIPLNGSQDFANVLRWHKISEGGETSLSGLDDEYNELIYTPGYEQVYLNGILLVKDSDYTATNGTTIADLDALSEGDVINIIALNSINIANTYTKAQADAKYVDQNEISDYLTIESASATYEPDIPYVSASPTSPTAGTLWIDSTDNSKPTLKVYNGIEWIAVSGAPSESGFHPFFGAYK